MTIPEPSLVAAVPAEENRRWSRRVMVAVGIGLVALFFVGWAVVLLIVSGNSASDVPTRCELGEETEAGGRDWRCTFVDEFDGATLDTSKWLVQNTAESSYHSGNECFVGPGKNVSVSGGRLHLTVLQEAAPFVCASPSGHYVTQHSSGMVSTWKRFSQAYGRFEIRARFPDVKVPGIHSALWLYPQDLLYGGWPHSGEIDIAEAYSSYPDRAIPYIHYAQSGKDPTVTNNRCRIKDLSSFHVYAAVWTPTSITITYDNETCLVHTWNPAKPLKGAAPFDKPFIVALTQALGITENAFNPATTPLPATTQVDYVRVWS